MSHTSSDYCAVFRAMGGYVFVTGDAPDLFEAVFATKREALLAASDCQTSRSADPNFTGHRDIKEIELYCREANQKSLAAKGINKLKGKK